MSLQTYINWIKTEVDKVSDPFFVETLTTGTGIIVDKVTKYYYG
jgi:hypothetical protein